MSKTILNRRDFRNKAVQTRVWHLVMWGGEVVAILLMLATRMPLYACILFFFLFSGIWVFASDKITDKIIYGSDK
jgi:hypothetical protein